MSRKRRAPPLDWTDVKSDDGTVIGRFAVRDGMITVQHHSGGQKTTGASGADDNMGLARLILSEFPKK